MSSKKVKQRSGGLQPPPMKRDASSTKTPLKVTAPVAMSRLMVSRTPKFSSRSNNITVSHCELVANVTNTTGVLQINNAITSSIGGVYKVNPAQGLFAWLSTLAANFDTYRFDKLIFRYVPMCATTETGRVVMMWDKDSEDPPPNDRFAISSYQHHCSFPCWGEGPLTIPVDGVKRFINDEAVVDRKLIDFGQFMFGVYGGSSTNSIGDIYVDYTVTLMEAQPTATLTFSTDGNSSVVANRNGPEIGQVFSSTNSITCKLYFAGTYLITIRAVTTATNPVFTILGNCTQLGNLHGVSNGSEWVGYATVSCSGVRSLLDSFTVITLTALGIYQVYVARISPSQAGL
ncbi:coat protein [Furcraea necrotic streak virus]|uniref:Capsid protein n=1 Tax=Furcraea necrotic streak virus TaxID=676234 RepID=D3U5B8_9TOMB|nr:coat protein [Furcraea necrotic streak virus]ACW84411.1 coat protein [Furcraea necrotic streak virus]